MLRVTDWFSQLFQDYIFRIAPLWQSTRVDVADTGHPGLYPQFISATGRAPS